MHDDDNNDNDLKTRFVPSLYKIKWPPGWAKLWPNISGPGLIVRRVISTTPNLNFRQCADFDTIFVHENVTYVCLCKLSEHLRVNTDTWTIIWTTFAEVHNNILYTKHISSRPSCIWQEDCTKKYKDEIFILFKVVVSQNILASKQVISGTLTFEHMCWKSISVLNGSK